MDMNQPDYDGRTALHVSSAEGQIQVVEFLLDRCKCSPFLVDRSVSSSWSSAFVFLDASLS